MDAQLILAKLKQYPIAVASVVLVIALAAATYLRGGALPEMQARMDQLNTQVSTIEFNAENAAGLEEDTKQMKSFVESVQGRLMSREDRAVNSSYFYGFTPDNGGFRIASVTQVAGGANQTGRPGGPAATAGDLKNFEVIQFTAQAEGSFKNILRFFRDLRRGEKILRIRDFGISPKGGLSDDLVVSLTINVLGKLPETQPAR